jgi:hypothetical protein
MQDQSEGERGSYRNCTIANLDEVAIREIIVIVFYAR